MQRIVVDSRLSTVHSNPTLPELKKYTSEIQLNQKIGIPCDLPNVPMMAIGVRLFEHHLAYGSFHTLLNLINSCQYNMLSVTNTPSHLAKFHTPQTITHNLTKTLQQLLRKSRQGLQDITRDLLQNLQCRPLLYFCMMCFLRSRAIFQLETNPQLYQYDLVGNEKQILEDYTTEVRGVCLEIIADGVGCVMRINGNGEKEKCGGTKWNPIEVELTVEQNRWMLAQSRKQTKLHRQQLLDSLPQRHYFPETQAHFFRSRSPENHLQPHPRVISQSVQKKPLAKLCLQCGKQKTQRFCQCRKSRATKQNLQPK